MRDKCPACNDDIFAIEDGKNVFCLNTQCNWWMTSRAWSEYCEILEYLKIKSEDEHISLEEFQ